MNHLFCFVKSAAARSYRRGVHITLSLLLLLPAAQAAEITVVSPAGTSILIRGRIDPGDHEKLLRLLRGKYVGNTVSLDSPGGSVLEALKLAAVVEQASLSTQVAGGAICESACFFIYLAGTWRRATGAEVFSDPDQWSHRRELLGREPPGVLGIHRPYSAQISSPENDQLRVMRAVTNYLERRLIPRRIIDEMMSRPSNDVYWLTSTDLHDIGVHPPNVEEYLIRTCGLDRNSNRRIVDAVEAGDRLTAQRLDASEAATDRCIAEQLNAAAKRGIDRIRKGWRPSVE